MIPFLEEVDPVGKQAFLWETEILPGKARRMVERWKNYYGSLKKEYICHHLSAVMNDPPSSTFGGLTFVPGSYHSPTWIGGVAVRGIQGPSLLPFQGYAIPLALTSFPGFHETSWQMSDKTEGVERCTQNLESRPGSGAHHFLNVPLVWTQSMTLPPIERWESVFSCVSGMKRRGIGEHQWCLHYREPRAHPGEVSSGFIRGERWRLSGTCQVKKNGAEWGVWGEQSKHRKWNRPTGLQIELDLSAGAQFSVPLPCLVLRCPGFQPQPFIPCSFRFGQSLETCLLF